MCFLLQKPSTLMPFQSAFPVPELANVLILLVLDPLISMVRKQDHSQLMNVRAFGVDDLPGDSSHKHLMAPTYLHCSSGPPPSPW